MDMELTEELKRILRCQGADLVGFHQDGVGSPFPDAPA